MSTNYIFSGGLTNVVLHCSLPQSLKPRNPNPDSSSISSSRVPTEVLLRLYGAIYYREG